MRLWSTVVSAPRTPACDAHTLDSRVSSSAAESPVSRGLSSSASSYRVLTMLIGSLQACEIGGDRLQVLGGEGNQWHVVAGLDGLRVGDPGGERAPRERQHASRDRLAA